MKASQASTSSIFNLFYLEKQDTAQKGITDPWVEMAANPHTGPVLRTSRNTPSTVTERLNKVLKVMVELLCHPNKQGRPESVLPQLYNILQFKEFLTRPLIPALGEEEAGGSL